MNPAAPQASYLSPLRGALESRCAKNPRYSLRSFARDLGLSPSHLSDVLNGRYGLSQSAAVKVARALGMSKAETSLFCDQVESAHGRDRKKRSAAQERVSSAGDYKSLTLDGFQVVSDWHHYAILELCLTKKFQSSSAWIAKQLGLSVHVAEAAIDRLKRLDLLLESPEGKLTPAEEFTASPDGIPSEAIRKFHKQVLERAIQALEFQSVDERDISTVMLALDSSRLGEAKADIKEFRRNFDKKFSTGTNRDQVYCFGTQLFRIQEKSSVSSKESKK